MPLNFMGLGFAFGAKDSGLDTALGGVSNQFKQLNDSLKEFQDTASVGFSPAEESIKGLSDSLASLGNIGDAAPGETFAESLAAELQGLKKEGESWSMSDLDLSLPSDSKDQVDDLTASVGGMAAEAALGGSKFGRMANSVLGGAGKITGAMGWVGLALGPVISGFGQAAESAGGMVDAVTGLPARVGNRIHAIATEGINLTNSLEGEAVAFGQTARQVGVNMGYTGANLRRFIGQTTGMAMGLNIGADEAARAIRAWDESAETLGATGLSSAQDVARLTASLGINADVLRNSTLEMRNLGASDEQIHRITSALTLMGQRTGDVSGALNELPQLVQMLERRRALGDTPEQMAAFAADTAAAARGLFQFTEDSERARQMASELAGTVTTSREAFQNMFAGTEDQLPQLATELAITTGDVQRSFQMMREGPGGLIQGIGELVQQTGGEGERFTRLMEFMRGRLQGVFGPEMTATLTGFWRTMSAETVSAMGDVRNASVDLGEMGREAHTTGRTMQEVFERLQASFQTTMRSFARQDSRDFMRRTRDSLRDLGVAAREAARSSGPLGDVMGLLSRSQQLGALALLPAELRGSAVAADQLHGQIMPLINAFASWGGVLDTVLSYVSIFATDVISAWGRITRTARRQGRDLDPMAALGEAIDQQAQRYSRIFIEFVGNVERWVTRAAEAFANLDFGALFETTPEGEEDQGVMGAIRRVIDRLGDVDWATIWKNIRTGLENVFEHVRPWLEEKVGQFREIIWNRIGEWWSAIDWNAVFSGTSDLAGGLWTAVQPALMALGRLVSEWFQDHWLDIVMFSSAALGSALLALIVGAVVAVVALALLPFVSMFGLIYSAWERWGDDFMDFMEGIGGWFVEQWDSLTEWYTDQWNETIDDLAQIWRLAQNAPTIFMNWLRGLWGGFVQWFRQRFPQTTQAIAEVLPQWQARFEALRDTIVNIWNSISESIGERITYLRETYIDPFLLAIETGWASIQEQVSTVWQTITDVVSTVGETLVGVPGQLRTAWEGIIGFFGTIFQRISETVRNALPSFTELSTGATTALDGIMATVVRLFGHSVHTVVGEDMAATQEVMIEAATGISEAIETILHDATVQAIITGFSEGFAAVVENMGEFSESMVDHFTTMAEGISAIMTELFTAVLMQAEVTLLGTETAVEGIIGRLRTITQAQAALAEARGAAAETLARPADEEAMRRRMAQLEGMPVLQAIHNPDWYSGGPGGEGRGYRELFIAKMDELHAAIVGIGTAPGAGSVEERRRLLETARETITRGRVGGQPGVPGGAGRR